LRMIGMRGAPGGALPMPSPSDVFPHTPALGGGRIRGGPLAGLGLSGGVGMTAGPGSLVALASGPASEGAAPGATLCPMSVFAGRVDVAPDASLSGREPSLSSATRGMLTGKQGPTSLRRSSELAR
jgi:hypothetical protein